MAKPSPRVLEELPVFVVEINHEMEEMGKWGLEWAVVGQNAGKNDEGVEEETGCGETGDDPSDQIVDSQEVVGEGVTEEEKSDLEHEWEKFHDQIEMPCCHSVDLPLSVPTAMNERPVHVGLRVSVEPLLAQHGNKCSEERDGQTGKKDGLNADEVGIGAIPWVIVAGLSWRVQIH